MEEGKLDLGTRTRSEVLRRVCLSMVCKAASQRKSLEINSGELQQSPYDYIYWNYPAHGPLR